jgi:gliding motility-associated-like protein
VNLSINRVINQSINVNLCTGESYTLPSGKIAHTTGTYKDTIRYAAGCDSLVTTVNLSVHSTINRSVNAVMCAGQLYRLPSGKMVNATGTYKDTLRYVGGCDSLIQTITLAQKPTIRSSVAKTICYGQPYTLPSGKVVSAAGTYLDTIRYAAGCDSAIVTVNVGVKPTIATNGNYAICSGKTYTLPSGRVVNTSGIYRDTIRYITGCDSLIAVVDLKVTQPLSQTIAVSICSGKTYTLPSGNLVNQAGTYRDTIRYASGCDSLVKTINLTVTPAPLISLTKSNDIDCILGTANLTTPAGYTYQWSPAATLSSTTINNPVASPVQTTTYRVKATTNKGCVAEDSIQVLVRKGNADNGYLVPSAFTPNSDGKNDCFGVKSWGTITDLNFYVYDRWGRIVFQTTDPSKCWDGTYNGEKLGAATFVYHVTANTNCGKVFRKGTVVLVR